MPGGFLSRKLLGLGGGGLEDCSSPWWVAQLVEHHPLHPKVVSSISRQGTSRRKMTGVSLSLPHCPSPPPSLESMIENALR